MGMTTEQRDSLWIEDNEPFRGHRVILARPGTGKTTTVSEYCIDLADSWQDRYAPWQGMAVISYTNVAKRELEAKIRDRGRARFLLSQPHFVGTIDSFLDQYIFLPFGSKEMSYGNGRPKLVGAPYSTWIASKPLRDGAPKSSFSPSSFEYYAFDLDGHVVRTRSRVPLNAQGYASVRAPNVDSGNASRIEAMKKYVWEHGYATQGDANYIAVQTLRASADLSRALISRFPVLVIDEAQDMTAMQHAFIDHLKSLGLEHLVLVGDECQAIYEWNTAKPKLLVDKVKDPEAGWSSKTIAQTFRCGPAICRALSRMAHSGLQLQPATQGKNQYYDEPIRVVGYDPADPGQQVKAAIDGLADVLAGKVSHASGKGETLTMAVITRARSDLARLRAFYAGGLAADSDVPHWGYRLTKDYLRILYHLLADDDYSAFGAYETLLLNAGGYKSKSAMRRALMLDWKLSQQSQAVYRLTMFDDLRKIKALLPAQNTLTISESELLCAAQLRGITEARMGYIERDCRSFKSSKKAQDCSLETLFGASGDHLFVRHPKRSNVQLCFSTVHGVKGETYDGVIYYLAEKIYPSCGCQPGKQKWSEILQHSLVDCEAKRITYVALSRAAQLLWVAAPQDNLQLWSELLEEPSRGGKLF